MKNIIVTLIAATLALAPAPVYAGVIMSGKTVIIIPRAPSHTPHRRSEQPTTQPGSQTSASQIELMSQLSGMGIPAVCIPALATSEEAYRNCSRKYARQALLAASAVFVRSYKRDYNEATTPDIYGCYLSKTTDYTTRQTELKFMTNNGYSEDDCDVEARLDLELQLIDALIEVRIAE